MLCRSTLVYTGETRVQAKVYCTASKATKVVVGLTLVALAAQAIHMTCELTADVVEVDLVFIVIFLAVVPLTVFIVNMIVLHHLRRRSDNVELQQHHSMPVVPTFMLVITSLIFVLFCGSSSTVWVVHKASPAIRDATRKWKAVTTALSYHVYAYNFFVYLITCKLFRSKLLRLFCRCCSQAAAADIT